MRKVNRAVDLPGEEDNLRGHLRIVCELAETTNSIFRDSTSEFETHQPRGTSTHANGRKGDSRPKRSWKAAEDPDQNCSFSMNAAGHASAPLPRRSNNLFRMSKSL
jgi:hypothetical protein